MKKLKDMFSSKILMLSIIIMIFTIALAISSTALISSVTINYPYTNQYNSSSTGSFVLNATAVWTDPTNVTNMTFWFKTGDTYTKYINSTVNGSRTSVTTGDFIVNISASALSEGAYTITAEARNSSDTITPSSSMNSSPITFTIDRTSPSVALNRPNDRSSITPANKVITFEYTPTDTNFGNCTLYISTVADSKATSDTTTPNVTNGAVNSFAKTYTADDSSESWYVSCKDLAGQTTNSATRTFNVIAFGGSPIEVTVGGGVPTTIPQQKPLAIAQVTKIASDTQNILKQWAMPLVIIIVALLIFAVFKIRQNKK
mgnify:CR=1 FL=1